MYLIKKEFSPLNYTSSKLILSFTPYLTILFISIAEFIVLIESGVCYPSLDSNSLIQNPYPIVRYLYPYATFYPFSTIVYPLTTPSPVLIVHSHPPSQTSPTTTLSFVLPISFLRNPHLLYPSSLSYLDF